MIKRFIIFFILIGAIVGGIVWFNLFRDQMIQQFFATMKPQPMTISTYKVEPVSWTPGIEAIGTIGAANGVDLTVQAVGIVKEVNFSANQRVEAGAVLVQLDDVVERASLEAAQTQLALARRALERAQQLQRSGAGTQSALDNARAAAETAQADSNRLQAVLDQKQLKAPFSGIIGIPRIELGQYIQPGGVVATLQNLDTMRVDFSIPEQQLGNLSIGQQVTLGLDGAAEGFDGKIAGIEPKVDATSRLVQVRAVVSNPNGRLSPGQFVQVRVELPREANVIAIPDTSLVSSLYGDFVYVVKPAPPPQPAAAPAATDATPAATPAATDATPVATDATPAATPAATDTAPAATGAAAPAAGGPDLVVNQVFVQAGRRSRGQVEILRNLAVGDEIVTAGQNKLSNNTPVVIDNSVVPIRNGANK